MFFIAGTGNKLKPCGRLPGAVPCPGCGGMEPPVVSKSYGYLHLFFLPLWRYGVTYLATCPSCGATRELNPIKGRELEERGTTVLSPGDLAEIRDPLPAWDGRYCTHCGGTLAPGDRFCARCGAPRRGK